MKKYLLGLTAIVLAIGFSAFTSTPKPAKKTNGKFTDYTLLIQASPTSSGIVTDLTNWTSRNVVECGENNANVMACQITTVSDVYLHDTTINSTVYQTPNRVGSTPTGESEFGTISETQASSTYYVSATSRGTAVNKTLP